VEVRWRGHGKFHGHPYVLKAPHACIWGGCLKFSSLEVLGLHFHHQHPRPFGLFVLMEYFPQGDKGVAVVEEDRFMKLSCLDTGKTLMGTIRMMWIECSFFTHPLYLLLVTFATAIRNSSGSHCWSTPTGHIGVQHSNDCGRPLCGGHF